MRFRRPFSASAILAARYEDDVTHSFRALHHAEKLLVLPNAWDVITARVVEAAGAPAIATSSAAVAWVHGARDGEKLAPAKLLETVQGIARAIAVPLSVDLEAGYHPEPEAIAPLVEALLGAGVKGVNLEDGYGDPGLLAKKIDVAKQVAAKAGQDLFVNARTDTYLRGPGGVEETLRRARIYEDAGADGLFVPRLAPAEIPAVVAGCGLPLNLLLYPNLPEAAELYRLGVRRLSAGSHIATGALGLVRRAAKELLATGKCAELFADPLLYADANALV
jgi:2-methylisocitrate lyase-like PEP mutase family enzyme